MKRKIESADDNGFDEEREKLTKIQKPSSSKSEEEDDMTMAQSTQFRKGGRESSVDQSHSAPQKPARFIDLGKQTSEAGDPATESRFGNVPPTYVYAEGAEQVPHTDGPSRMILSHDGSKPSIALLLDVDLGMDLWDLVTSDQQYSLFQTKQHEQKTLLDAFREHAKEEERRLLHRYQKLEGVLDSGPKRKKCQEKSRDLHSKLKEADELEQETTKKVESAVAQVQTAKCKVVDAIRNILEESGLVAKAPNASLDPETVGKFTVSNEDSPSLGSSASTVSAEGKRLSPPQMRTEPPPVHQLDEPLKELRREYWNAFYGLQKAQAAFDLRTAVRDEKAVIFRKQLASSQPPKESTEDFELRHLIRARELTGQLIEAEETFAAAKSKAVAAGVRIGNATQSSGFVPTSEDGLASGEIIPSELIYAPSILKWLGDIPEAENEGEWPRLPSPRLDTGDGWEFKEVDICDSASAIAEGTERRRIDQWRKR